MMEFRAIRKKEGIGIVKVFLQIFMRDGVLLVRETKGDGVTFFFFQSLVLYSTVWIFLYDFFGELKGEFFLDEVKFYRCLDKCLFKNSSSIRVLFIVRIVGDGFFNLGIYFQYSETIGFSLLRSKGV